MTKHATVVSPFSLVQPVPHARETMIAFDDVSKAFASKQGLTQALDKVSLKIGRGQFVALVGPSGCGKTTLLNLIAGLVTADAGRVLYGADEVHSPNARVGYLTQLDALLPWRSVLSNVALPLEIRHVPKAERLRRARDIISRVGLEGFESHYPAQLSGGMRKRVAIARTLVYNPETLLLDEPFSALDAQTRIVIQRQLQDLVKELGLTVLLVTHDINEAVSLADTVVVFSKRPARVLETIDIGGTNRSAARKSEDPLYERIWGLLANQIDIAAA
jgi:NitT/TauT family transport system ATP-binding protein